MVRRIVGLAKTSDIETLEPELRIGAARGVLRAAQMAVRERHSNTDIPSLTKKIRKIIDEVRTSEGK
jgi:5-methylthioribose kinase